MGIPRIKSESVFAPVTKEFFLLTMIDGRGCERVAPMDPRSAGPEEWKLESLASVMRRRV